MEAKMMEEMEQDFALVGAVYALEKAGFSFAGVSDAAIQDAFSRGLDLEKMAVKRAA